MTANNVFDTLEYDCDCGGPRGAKHTYQQTFICTEYIWILSHANEWKITNEYRERCTNGNEAEGSTINTYNNNEQKKYENSKALFTRQAIARPTIVKEI